MNCPCGIPLVRQQKKYCSKACEAANRKSGPESNRWAGGKSKHPLYGVYCDMVKRCHSRDNPHYYKYGGRGIFVDAYWLLDFWNFVTDVGERPEGTSLDRINNDGPYTKENCRWSTPTEQANNRHHGSKWHSYHIKESNDKS